MVEVIKPSAKNLHLLYYSQMLFACVTLLWLPFKTKIIEYNFLVSRSSLSQLINILIDYML